MGWFLLNWQRTMENPTFFGLFPPKITTQGDFHNGRRALWKGRDLIF